MRRHRVSVQDRIDNACAVELAKFARSSTNIAQACADGRITEHDRDERIARAEYWCACRVAFISGLPRPPYRPQVPLDDPDAGTVG